LSFSAAYHPKRVQTSFMLWHKPDDDDDDDDDLQWV
jgi:hypothetical protein